MSIGAASNENGGVWKHAVYARGERQRGGRCGPHSNNAESFLRPCLARPNISDCVLESLLGLISESNRTSEPIEQQSHRLGVGAATDQWGERLYYGGQLQRLT